MRVAQKAALIISLIFAFHAGAYGPWSTRSLLEKPIYYLDENGKAGSCTYWALHLGKHSCTIKKYFPGEGDVPVNAEVNFNLLSSLYIEGAGYSSRGKIGSDGSLAAGSEDNITGFAIDSIDYIYGRGTKVARLGSEVEDLYLRVQTNDLRIRRMVLRKYTYNKTYAELNHEEDIPIVAFSFTKAGLQKAKSENAKLSK